MSKRGLPNRLRRIVRKPKYLSYDRIMNLTPEQEEVLMKRCFPIQRVIYPKMISSDLFTVVPEGIEYTESNDPMRGFS